jgi:hypothetical protein
MINELLATKWNFIMKELKGDDIFGKGIQPFYSLAGG